MPWLLTLILALALLFVPGMPSPAQMPAIDPAPVEAGSEQLRPWWDTISASRCGRFWCSDVVLSRLASAQHGEMVLAYQPSLGMGSTAAALQAERRAEAVQVTLAELRQAMVRRWREQPLAPLQASKGQGRLFWLFSTAKPLHPLTPPVAIGIRNKATVLYLPDAADALLPRQVLVTVTRPDALQSALTIPVLAERWRMQIRASLSEQLWGAEYDRRYPFARLQIALLILLVAAGVIVMLSLLRRLMRQLQRRLRHRENALREGTRQFAIAEAQGQAQSDREAPAVQPSRTADAASSRWLSRRLHLPAAALGRQALVAQGLILLDQGLMIANFLRLVCGLAALVLVAFLFPATRFGSEVVFYQAIALLITWLLLLLGRFVALLVLNYNVQSWVRRMSSQQESNRRYALRGVTYTRVLRGALTLLMVLVGLMISLLLLGADQRVFTGAGVVAVGLGLLARNLLEDLLNGVMILANDRYAIGDVITIPPHSGFVESLNLFITQLRGWDGQVITLPNGQIRVVENLTKDWSRVNFEIEVQLDQDLRPVLQLARQVADGLAADPDWADCLIGSADILGVDAINHQGSLIRIWIRTRPHAQWLVGREFRLRLKEAFDREGIAVGRPIQSLQLQKERPSQR